MNVLLFGIAKDIVGKSELNLESNNTIQSVSDLISYLKNTYPEFQQLDALAVAVNNTYATPEKALTDKDEIAIIPPVSGG